MDGWMMDGWMDGWMMDGCMDDGWMDGRSDGVTVTALVDHVHVGLLQMLSSVTLVTGVCGSSRMD